MRKVAVGLIALVLASVITSDAVSARRQPFSPSPVFSHQPSFHQPSFIYQPSFPFASRTSFTSRPTFASRPSFTSRPTGKRRAFVFYSGPILAPYYLNYHPLY